jgi:drug/metabolite transporter (DMT)-like permease
MGFLLSFLGALFLSTKAILVKLALHNVHTDGVTLLALRMLSSLPFFAVTAMWLTRREHNVRMNARQWTWVIVLGLMGYYLSSLFDFIGLQYISAGLERLILFLYPSFSVLINALAFRQRITRVQFLALALTYTGIGIAYFGELRIDTGNVYFYWGSFLVFLCAITYAIYLSGMGRVVPSLGAPVLPHGPDAGTLWGYGLALAVIATVIPSYLISTGMKRIGANNAAIVTSVGPVSTIVQAHFFLGEPIFAEQIIGTVLVIVGVLLVGWRGK